MGQDSVEKIVAEIKGLPPQERLRLIRIVVDTLIVPAKPEESHPLAYGAFHGNRMSTEGDFRLAEWSPHDPDLNGP
jgi:hypothetical protein